MDRFIVQSVHLYSIFIANLKSNMDRFIVGRYTFARMYDPYLKSNMDRFIGITQRRWLGLCNI